MISTALQRAMAEWDSEVDSVMVRLIQRGVPPFDAAIRAREIVSARRRASPNQDTPSVEE